MVPFRRDNAPVLMARVRQLRARRAVDRLDELRALVLLAKQLPQAAIAKALAVSQPAVSKRVREAAAMPAVRPGFSGASAYEIAQRYAAGLLSRERTLEELSRWSYVPADQGDGVDWLSYRPGELEVQVGKALDHGLIDEPMYDEVVRAQAQQLDGVTHDK